MKTLRGFRFIIRNRMFGPRYWGPGLRFLWFRLRNPHIVCRGFVFIARGAEITCRRGLGHMELGRFVRVGRESALRCHEGMLVVGDKVVFGGRTTVNAYLHVEIGEESLFGDLIHVTDFDHRYEDPATPIRKQGIVASPVRIGRDCWVGEKATILRGVRLGDGCVVGAQAVVKGEYPKNSVIVGNPGRMVKRRGG